MGEVKHRGTFEERRAAAISRDAGAPPKPQRRYRYFTPLSTPALSFLWSRFKVGKDGKTVGEIVAQAKDEQEKAKADRVVRDSPLV